MPIVEDTVTEGKGVVEETLKNESKSGLYCVRSESEVLDYKSFMVHFFKTIAKCKVKFSIYLTVPCRIDTIRHSYDVLFRKPSNLSIHRNTNLLHLVNMIKPHENRQ